MFIYIVLFIMLLRTQYGSKYRIRKTTCLKFSRQQQCVTAAVLLIVAKFAAGAAAER